MIEFTKEEKEIINLLIDKKQLFVLFKMPGHSKIHFRMQSVGDPELFYDLADLNSKSGFVIAPFDISRSYPAVLLKPDTYKLPSKEELFKLESRYSNFNDGSTSISSSVLSASIHEEYEAYASTFELFKDELSKTSLQKLVLSRTSEHFYENLSVADAYEKACCSYPNGYVYLVYTPSTGLWMGSTPEILLKGDGSMWHTVALAGTQKHHEGVVVWDKKNQEEQAIVERYVKKQLEDFGVNPYVIGPKNIRAGKLLHLVSYFNFTMQENKNIGELLKSLHPTPAVCGLPKEEAFKFIVETESHDRKYYSGFIGDLLPAGETNIYVNLRCIHIEPSSYTLYAGGGILTSSEVDQEWEETVNKMDTIKSILN